MAGYIFTHDEAKRVANAVKANEGRPHTRLPPRPRPYRGTGGGGGACECPEVHEFYTNTTTTAGTFTANYDVNGTAEDVTWDWDATASEVQTAFEGHSEIASGEVAVSGGPWPDVALYVEFTIAGLTNVNFPTVDNTSLTGNAAMRRFSKGV